MSGDVSSSSHFDIVCLVTPTFSANSSCDKLFFFLKFEILFPILTHYTLKILPIFYGIYAIFLNMNY